jgi:hypothetical protein
MIHPTVRPIGLSEAVVTPPSEWRVGTTRGEAVVD